MIGKAYFAQLDIESKILANAQNIYAERYISVGVFSYTPTFIENLGAVRELDQGGYSVDIIGNNCAAVSLDGNETSEKAITLVQDMFLHTLNIWYWNSL